MFVGSNGYLENSDLRERLRKISCCPLSKARSKADLSNAFGRNGFAPAESNLSVHFRKLFKTEIWRQLLEPSIRSSRLVPFNNISFIFSFSCDSDKFIMSEQGRNPSPAKSSQEKKKKFLDPIFYTAPTVKIPLQYII